MKRIFILTCLLSACGHNGGPSISPTPQASPPASPTPTPLSQALVGNWVMGTNTLSFKEDGTARSNQQSLTWAIDASNEIVFSENSVEVDTCGWNILTSGGLLSNLITTLDLACEKVGALTYTRAP